MDGQAKEELVVDQFLLGMDNHELSVQVDLHMVTGTPKMCSDWLGPWRQCMRRRGMRPVPESLLRRHTL